MPIESMHSDIKRIAEGHSTLVAKLNEHDKRFDAIDRKFDILETAVSENRKDIKDIKGKLNTVLTNLEGRIKKLELIK